uniref:Uncharacterized protein n=1 Tax=Storeatula sp. CCMP1868 TaxID=195070 RepID=A0A222AHM9_9CRYP|nr:hypothetical protein [Storeatula sp. CCMP1868]
MNDKELLIKNEYRKILFTRLALKFNNDLQINNSNSQHFLGLNLLNNELKAYILIIVLEETESLVNRLLENIIYEKIDYVITLIIINSGIKLSKNLPELFYSLSYSSKNTLWILEDLVIQEGYFLDELLHYLFIKKIKKRNNHKQVIQTFSLILENLIIKISDTLVSLYVLQKNIFKVLKNQQVTICILKTNKRFSE